MTFIYQDGIHCIVHIDDESVMADLDECVSRCDAFKMAAAPELFSALEAIVYAVGIGEFEMPAALILSAWDALNAARAPEDAL